MWCARRHYINPFGAESILLGIALLSISNVAVLKELRPKYLLEDERDLKLCDKLIGFGISVCEHYSICYLE